ncbi:hypothetical protein BC941DRAFT_510960 [Chlamydoabsidia padenii]|nr:hypothetical protein BC941DRAFT_510960 [Chlamydoabsidia padenii]
MNPEKAGHRKDNVVAALDDYYVEQAVKTLQHPLITNHLQPSDTFLTLTLQLSATAPLSPFTKNNNYRVCPNKIQCLLKDLKQQITIFNYMTHTKLYNRHDVGGPYF